MKTRLVCGVGVVDVSYVVQKKVRVAKGRGKGTQKLEWICPYYLKWRCMIDRCYSNKKLSSDPSYGGCSVVKEWL
ncbi:hypothetical protein, partial [Flavobacterium sp.]|uniref:hypothetical protein n=1 Tax=Flavobacterium sp. TaxID=239 RepID=UPI0037C16F7C